MADVCWMGGGGVLGFKRGCWASAERWIGLQIPLDTTRVGNVLSFTFWFWNFTNFQSSRLLHINISLMYSFYADSLYRILYSHMLALFYLMKKSAKCCESCLPNPTPNRPLSIKCIVPAFLGDRFEGKEGGLRTYPAGTCQSWDI